MTDIQKEKLYHEYYGKVHGYIISRANNAQDAEDITADVFVKIYEKIDTFDQNKASLSTWIYTITRNTLIDYYRRRKVFAELPDDIMDDDILEDKFCNAESLKILTKALKHLDERERNIIILYYYSGNKLTEIAEKLDISYPYIRVLHNKALEKMKKYFK